MPKSTRKFATGKLAETRPDFPLISHPKGRFPAFSAWSVAAALGLGLSFYG
jgi:hypothetical protein